MNFFKLRRLIQVSVYMLLHCAGCANTWNGVVGQGIIDYNFLCFKKAIEEVFEVRLQTQAIDAGSSALHSPIESVMLDNPQTNGIGSVSKSS